MPTLSKVFLHPGLALALGCGLLQAEPPAPGARGSEGPVPQAEAEPVLKPHPIQGANLDFTGGADLQEVLLRLGKAAGVRVTLHASVLAQETRVRADLGNLPFRQALDLLMLQNNLFCKVLAPDAVMVFKKTPQNLSDFEVRSVRTLYLSHADVDTVRQNLNAILPMVRVFIDRRLNAITIQANPADTAAVQRIVANLDKATGEVAVQMEILEADRHAARAAGLPALADAVPPREGPRPGIERALDALRKDGGTRLLARPELRVVGGETAEIRAGQTAAAKEGGEGAAAQPSGGFRVKVRPRIHPDGTLTLALDYAVTTAPAPGAPKGQGHDEQALWTSVRVQDGETVAFSGLLPEGAGTADASKDRILVLKARVIRKPD